MWRVGGGSASWRGTQAVRESEATRSWDQREGTSALTMGEGVWRGTRGEDGGAVGLEQAWGGKGSV